jgi:hypothetical protein
MRVLVQNYWFWYILELQVVLDYIVLSFDRGNLIGLLDPF